MVGFYLFVGLVFFGGAGWLIPSCTQGLLVLCSEIPASRLGRPYRLLGMNLGGPCAMQKPSPFYYFSGRKTGFESFKFFKLKAAIYMKNIIVSGRVILFLDNFLLICKLII